MNVFANDFKIVVKEGNNLEKIQKLFHLIDVNQKWEILQSAINKNSFPIVSFLAPHLTLNRPYQTTAMFMALINKPFSLKMVKLLFSKCSHFSESEIQVAFSLKSLELIKFLFEIGKLSQKPKRWAEVSTKYGDLEIVKFLESIYNNSREIDVNDWLEFAVLGNHIQIVQYFIEKTPHILSKYVATACQLGNFEIFNCLIEKLMTTFIPSIYLPHAIQGRNLDILKYLFEQGANLNQIDSEGLIPLYLASRKEDFKMVCWLVENGANVNLENTKLNETALWAALEKANFEIAQFLISKGANLDHEVSNHNYFWIAILASPSLDFVKLLVDNGCDFRFVDQRGENLLFVASYYNRLDIVQYLIKKGLDVNKQNKYKKTPLFSSNLLTMTILLVENGADVTLKDDLDENVCSEAVVRNSYSIVEYLLSLKRFDLKTKTQILEKAIRYQRGTILELIVRNGFDNLQDLISAQEICVEKHNALFNANVDMRNILNKLVEEQKLKYSTQL